MIPVTRISEPDILRQKANEWLTALKIEIDNFKQVDSNPSSEVKDRKTAQAKVKSARNRYNPGKNSRGINPIKQALYDMFSGKCAFCERKVEISTAHIEHFKPKSLHVDLTFDWNNLLYSCEVCNNAEHKGDKFPLDCDGTPLLIDPTDENCDIYEYLDVYWDAKAKSAHIIGKNGRGKVVEEIFQLNRKDLRIHRSKQVKKILTILKFAQGNDIEAIEARQLLTESCKLDNEYSAFALFYICPYLAHHFQILEAIEIIKKVSQRSHNYSEFARFDDLVDYLQ